MNNHAKIVLWLGLFMIVAGIARNWHVFSSVIFGSGTGGNPNNPGVGSRSPYVPNTPGQCGKGFIWNTQLQACVPKLGIEH